MTEKEPCGACEKAECSARSQRGGESEQEFLERRQLQSTLCRIMHKVLVLSGKGGVGKSTAAVNIAASLSLTGARVGLLDVDIHGPSIPRMLGLEGMQARADNGKLLPVESGALKVMSMAFLLRGAGQAVIWRGPLKMTLIRQFLKDVLWGELDYLVVDCPPGTGDEPLSVVQLIPGADGAVIVTTPQEVALSDVRRCVNFCWRVNLPVLGVIENMSGFVCPGCGRTFDIFGSGGGERMAGEMAVPFLGHVPIDPAVVDSTDCGEPLVAGRAETAAARAFASAAETIRARLERGA